MAGGAAVWCRYDVRAGCCCPLLYSYVGRGGVRSPTGAGIIGPARGGGGAWRRAYGGRRARSPTGAASSARRGLSGAICPAVRGAAALSYIALCRARRGAISYRRGHHRPGAGRRRGVACPAAAGGGGDLLPARHHRAATGKPPRESRPRKTPHGKRPTENGQQKRGRRGGGPCLPLFRVMLPGRSFFRGVVRGGRLESIAGHSFPRGRQNVSLHTFARLSGGGFYFFRVRFRRFQIYLCAFC